MHISEGVLSTPVLTAGIGLSTVGIAIGLRKLDYDKIMMASMLTSTFFVANLIHIPVGPGSVHLSLCGLMGVLMGWACFPAIAVALLLQAILFQYGGIYVLGVNTFIMAAPAICCFYIFSPLLRASGKKRAAAGFLAGGLSVLFSALLLATSLHLSDEGFLRAAQATVLIQLPMVCIEGLITMFIVSFLMKVQPEFFTLSRL